MRNTRIPNRREPRRRGATAVEFAVVVPLVFFFFFAMLEFSRANVIRNSIQSAAYEGARSAIVPGATADDARAAAFQILNAVTAVNASVTINPATITQLTPEVTVTIAVPLDDNGWVTAKFFQGRTLTSSVTLIRESSEFTAF